MRVSAQAMIVFVQSFYPGPGKDSVMSWDLLRRIVADRRNTQGTIYYTRGRPVHNGSCAVQNTKAMT